MTPIISANNVRFTYDRETFALDDVTLHVAPGEFLCILGGNGSGKSTFAKHINALLLPDEGEVLVCSQPTSDQEALYQIRSSAGMVFQNPDDQIVASVIEDDVAFGPENLGVPTDELRTRVQVALAQVGLQGFERHHTYELSGGQKQRVAIAGALAMHPQILVLDEASAMLDPRGRSGLMKACRKLNDEGLTIVLITHFMEEAAQADRVVVLRDGKLVLDGTPRDVLERADELQDLSLDVPFTVRMSIKLQEAGVPIRTHLFEEDLVADVQKTIGAQSSSPAAPSARRQDGENAPQQPLLEFRNVSYSYVHKSDRKRIKKLRSKGSKERKWGNSPHVLWALDDISLTVNHGEFIGLAGHTGSGKSTLTQLASGLLHATRGTVLLHGIDLTDKKGTAEARAEVGLVFQYPENQLFAQNVYDDVAFGPRNLGLSAEEVDSRVKDSLMFMGLDVEELRDMSPFALSGGQQRRVAIAGVLAMQPKVLILDEPTAGLDPVSHDALLELFKEIHKRYDLTIILVSHNMDDIANLCTRAILLNQGKVFADGTPFEVFSHAEDVKSIGLGVPSTLDLANKLGITGLTNVPSVDELTQLVAAAAACPSNAEGTVK